MSENENKDEPKLIIDDDWKEQVAKEKAAALNPEVPGVETTPDETASPDTSVAQEKPAPSGADDDFPPPPPASFDVLISMLFTQAMAMLGQMPDPATGKSTVNKVYAKHYIDTLDMLGQKTKGNLTDEEGKMLSEALHALRMTYVSVRSSQGS